MPDAPASLPTVVAVGGTALTLNANGTRASETVWNDNGPGDESGGSIRSGRRAAAAARCSARSPGRATRRATRRPDAGGKRLAADVSAVGESIHRIDIYDSYQCGPECKPHGGREGWLTFGGTSLSTPIISAMYALAGGGGGVEYPALSLYGHAATPPSRFDVTEGGNGYCGDAVNPRAMPTQFRRVASTAKERRPAMPAPGFDGPSGVGTPNGLAMFKPLLPTATITSPASLTAGASASFSAASSQRPLSRRLAHELLVELGRRNGAGSGGISPAHTYAAPGNTP